MISYFPSIYSDESIYSIISRYHNHMGNVSPKWTSQELFDNKRVNPSLHWGASIKSLIDKISITDELIIEDFISNHTFINVYKPFVLEDRYNKAFESIEIGELQKVNLYLGIKAGEIFEKNIVKVCEKCIENDFEKYGETYLRTNHQVPGNIVCLEHNHMLSMIEVDIMVQEYYKYNKYKSRISDIAVGNNDVKKELANISKEINFLLKNYRDLDFFKETKIKIFSRMKEKNYIYTNGAVKQKEVQNDLIEYYGEEFLNIVKSAIDIDDQQNWFRRFCLKKATSIHPLRGILVISFLFGSLENFMKYKLEEVEPFGEGPWQCLNPICDNYKSVCINNYYSKINKNNGNVLGVFRCECGYEYKITGPIISLESLYDSYTVSDRGDMWLKRLEKEVKNGTSINRIAKILGTSKQTVKKYIVKLDLTDCFSDKGIKFEELKYKSSNEINELKKEEYLDRIRKLINENKNELNRSQIIAKLRREYYWLRRNYNESLEDILPKAIAPKDKYKYSSKSQIEWNERDDNCYTRINSIKNEFKGRRVTTSMIAKRLRYHDLYIYLDKMPKTKKLIEELVSKKCNE